MTAMQKSVRDLEPGDRLSNLGTFTVTGIVVNKHGKVTVFTKEGYMVNFSAGEVVEVE